MDNFARMEQTTDIVLQTRYLDDLVAKAAFTIKQIVILSCDGDFRPYRLPLIKSSSVADFYLLDVPQVLACRVRHIFTEFCSVDVDCTSFQQIGTMYGR